MSSARHGRVYTRCTKRKSVAVNHDCVGRRPASCASAGHVAWRATSHVTAMAPIAALLSSFASTAPSGLWTCFRRPGTGDRGCAVPDGVAPRPARCQVHQTMARDARGITPSPRLPGRPPRRAAEQQIRSGTAGSRSSLLHVHTAIRLAGGAAAATVRWPANTLSCSYSGIRGTRSRKLKRQAASPGLRCRDG